MTLKSAKKLAKQMMRKHCKTIRKPSEPIRKRSEKPGFEKATF